MPLAPLPTHLLPSAAMLVVHVRLNGQELPSYHFEQSEITVGRIQGQDIEFPASQVSRRHARIACHGDRVRVMDNGSSNGTKVNGRRIQGVVEGRFSEMTVDICGYQLTFEVTEGKTDQAPRCSESPTSSQSEITAPTLKQQSCENNGPPSRPSVRKFLDLVLTTDDEFDAFCSDYFEEIHQSFSGAMTRISKQTLLLQKVSRVEIVLALRKHSFDKVQRHQHVLEY